MTNNTLFGKMDTFLGFCLGNFMSTPHLPALKPVANPLSVKKLQRNWSFWANPEKKYSDQKSSHSSLIKTGQYNKDILKQAMFREIPAQNSGIGSKKNLIFE